MAKSNKYAVPLAALDSAKVPFEQQVEERDIRTHRDYLSAEELDRSRLLSITEAGRLRTR